MFIFIYSSIREALKVGCKLTMYRAITCNGDTILVSATPGIAQCIFGVSAILLPIGYEDYELPTFKD